MTFEDEDRYRGNAIVSSKESSYYYNWFLRVAANVYEWEGLPDEIDMSLLEYHLTYKGNILMFKTKEQSYVLADSSAESGGFDIYGRPRMVTPQFINNSGPYAKYEKPILTDGINCAIAYDTSVPGIWRMNELVRSKYMEDLVDLDLTVRQQILNQRQPLMIKTNSLKQQKDRWLTSKILNGFKVIFLSDDAPNFEIEPLKIDAPYNVDSLITTKKQIINFCLEILGVDNAQASPKKERMIIDEMEANDELLNIILADGLDARMTFAEKCNRIWGLNMKPKIREIVRPIMLSENTGETNADNIQDYPAKR